MKGIIKCNPHKKVDTMDWAATHIGCNALIEKELNIGEIVIVAYAESPEYNGTLQQLITSNTLIFQNVSEEDINSID